MLVQSLIKYVLQIIWYQIMQKFKNTQLCQAVFDCLVAE